MADPVRVGVIGVGQIGKHHLNTYAQIPDAQVVAVADVNAEEAQRVAQHFGVETVYTDFRDLLKRDDIQAVDVALHNNLHMPVTVAALEAGKHVYCEKPMAGAYIDAEKMLKTAQATGRFLHIQLNTLFANETKAAKALIDAGKLGKLYHARSLGYRRRGRPYVDGYGSQFFVQKEHAAGGALYDMGVYHIARILYLLGNPEVQAVSGKTYQETAMDEGRQRASGYSVEELGLGFVRMANNISVDIIESWAVHAGEFDGSAVYGSDGGVRLNPFGYFFGIGDLSFSAETDLGEFAYRLRQLRDDAVENSQQHWIKALQGRVPLVPAAEIALNTMLISEGIYLSNQLGREVTADEVREKSVSTAMKI